MAEHSAERLPPLAPDELDDEQRAVYDALVSGPRSGGAQPAGGDRRSDGDRHGGGSRSGRGPKPGFVDDDGRLLGPFNAMLYSPAVGRPLQDLGAAIRFRTGLTGREREIATLVAAARQRSDYEWYAHERIGRAAGLTDAELDALRTGTAPAFIDVREQAVYELVRALTIDEDVDDAAYFGAVAELGRRVVVEVVTLVGYYRALALQLRVFRVGVPDGEPAPGWS